MSFAQIETPRAWDGGDRRRLHDPDYSGPERRGRPYDRRQDGTEQAVLDRLAAIERRLDAGSKRMDRQDEMRREQAANLKQNTSMTAELLGLFQTAKGGLKFLEVLGVVGKWLGGLAAAAVAVYSAYHVMRYGRPPGT
ncbi:MAG: hypothetical protein RJA98_3967 [Pseudomonadota bacterium]|jgi:hypothetical protein